MPDILVFPQLYSLWTADQLKSSKSQCLTLSPEPKPYSYMGMDSGTARTDRNRPRVLRETGSFHVFQDTALCTYGWLDIELQEWVWNELGLLDSLNAWLSISPGSRTV